MFSKQMLGKSATDSAKTIAIAYSLIEDKAKEGGGEGGRWPDYDNVLVILVF